MRFVTKEKGTHKIHKKINGFRPCNIKPSHPVSKPKLYVLSHIQIRACNMYVNICEQMYMQAQSEAGRRIRKADVR